MTTLGAFFLGLGSLYALYFSMVSFYHRNILVGIGVFALGWVAAHGSNHLFDKIKKKEAA
jgi:hypothetical protein